MEPLQSTLLAQLTQVPDFRKARGRRYAWSYLLAIMTAAIAAGQKGVLEMATWAQQHTAVLLSTLQPDCPRIPSAATLRRVLCRMDLAALENQVAAYGQALDAADAAAGGVKTADGQMLRGQAVDGKDVRGASTHGQPTFLVSLVRHGSAYVLGQAAVDVKTNEITVVPTLLAGRNLQGTVTTMDALLTQRAIARQILAQKGHYLMIVKENQPALYTAIAFLFRMPPVPAHPSELLSYQTRGKAHGRREWRQLESSTALNTYLDWPGVAQVMRRTCRRVSIRTGQVETKTTYGITSLPHPLAGPQQLEHLWRSHWTIENSLHHVRDVTLAEDRCQLHTGNAPQALAALRNAILALFRYHGWSNIAAATRHYAARPHRALQLLGAFTT